MAKKNLCQKSNKLKDVGTIWLAIFVLTIAALISLIFALFRKDGNIFEQRQWENDDSIGLGRGFIVAIITVILSLLASSYGFWRQCLDTSKFGDTF